MTYLLFVLCVILLAKVLYSSVVEKRGKAAVNKLEAEAQAHLAAAQEREKAAEERYQNILNERQKDLDLFFESQRATRQSELDTEYDNLKRYHEEQALAAINQTNEEMRERITQATDKYCEFEQQLEKNKQAILDDVTREQVKYEGLIEPIKNLELEKSERQFYSIQVSNEGKDDIQFLIEDVMPHLKNEKVIGKVIYEEYVKGPLSDTLKRIGAEEQAGIYKITSLTSGKAYIGKSVNVKRRLVDHVKGALHIGSIGKQAIHDAMSEAIWDWMFEIVTYCDPSELNEFEAYYINFFKTTDPLVGYNKKAGG